MCQAQDYDWLEQPREQQRRQGIRARLHLAELLADSDPRQAAALSQAAADLAPYSDDIAQRAMQALARIGDTAAVSARYGRLRDALQDIDEEPSAETIALAAQLQQTDRTAPDYGDVRHGRPYVHLPDASR
ncbi:bacterial transcriptional activator domain-containing protein [Polymorphospora rubra]|uniref:bacterial transcriptional activator domain-containing protein n=1 Tax=Polymorphospora rubra TaxID=338584 RepID=UPI001FE8423A|nr:bacterial transcriptional activator domain-containing protein [Polymorphospora rubra]